jgi:hypothetical protein
MVGNPGIATSFKIFTNKLHQDKRSFVFIINYYQTNYANLCLYLTRPLTPLTLFLTSDPKTDNHWYKNTSKSC